MNKKLLMIFTALTLLLSSRIPATAQEPLAGFDFEKVLKTTRAGFFVNQHMDRFASAYIPIKTFHKNNVEYLSLGAGYIKNVDIGDKDSPLLQLGFRLDNLMNLIDKTDWGKKHIVSAKLPTLEFGPALTTWFEKKNNGNWTIKIYYGVNIAIGF